MRCSGGIEPRSSSVKPERRISADFEVWRRRRAVGEGAGGRIEVELGVEDWVGNLELAEGVLVNLGVGGFGEEEGDGGDAGAAGDGPAPAVLGGAGRPGHGLGFAENPSSSPSPTPPRRLFTTSAPDTTSTPPGPSPPRRPVTPSSLDTPSVDPSPPRRSDSTGAPHLETTSAGDPVTNPVPPIPTQNMDINSSFLNEDLNGANIEAADIIGVDLEHPELEPPEMLEQEEGELVLSRRRWRISGSVCVNLFDPKPNSYQYVACLSEILWLQSEFYSHTQSVYANLEIAAGRKPRSKADVFLVEDSIL
ncbi:tetratricopeptide repeat protein [Striga asiatica]|uniref:Tetratricopeptide repeat protein n=1 Tax=Striga asiatica TaxID=4170 RepID=A0A5A7PN73_STRAF|nr:tetratricopeptide repeat protein [Striga asiatica]